MIDEINMNTLLRVTIAFSSAALLSPARASAGEHYAFAVLPQRSAALTAEYWDPLLGHFAAREELKVRVIWESRPFHSIPIAAHPRVPEAVARAVQQALVQVDRDEEGEKILAVSAKAIGQNPPVGFELARPEDYRDQIEFHRSSVLKNLE